MITQTHITIDDSRAAEGRRSATLHIPGAPVEVWFQSYDGALPIEAGADPFLLAALLLLMQDGKDVHVEGVVTARALRNLAELQEVWANWRPAKYRRITITADEVHADGHSGGAQAIAAFSGGVDASYTVLTHAVNRKPTSVELGAVLFVHGFDVPLNAPAEYASARKRGEKMIAGLGLQSLGVATNFRTLGQEWEDAFGLGVAACLTLYQTRYAVGLIGSSEAYGELVLPWGSSPVTDHLYTTGMMEILHDGAGATRTQKIEALTEWPESMQYLRVCWQGEHVDRNCGQCEKCVRTYLNLRAVGVREPMMFESVPGRRIVRSVKAGSAPLLNELKSIAKYAEQRGQDGEWLTDLRFAIRVNRLRVEARRNRRVLSLVRRLKPVPK